MRVMAQACSLTARIESLQTRAPLQIEFLQTGAEVQIRDVKKWRGAGNLLDWRFEVLPLERAKC